MAYIEFNDVVKEYPAGSSSIRALDGASFAADEGELSVILGQSGAGKTTALNILGGMDTATSGRVIVGGRDITDLNHHDLVTYRRNDIGFVFQFHQLLPEFTALENVAIPALIKGDRAADAYKRAAELIDYMGLSGRADHKPAALSGGEKQRIAVARALMNRPSVIFADEPSGSLDSRNKEELHRLFFDLRREFSQTFVIVTHDESLAMMCDRVLTMRDGVIVSDMKKEKIDE